MSTEILDYPNSKQEVILTKEQKSKIQGLTISIYGLQVTDYGLYLCALPGSK